MCFRVRHSLVIKLDLDAGDSLVQGLGSLARICKLLLSSCVLLFFALYTPGSPPISGAHWSVKQSKLQSSSSLTASSRPQQAAGQRLLPKFSKSKRPPLKTHLFKILDRWTPTEVWRILVLQEPEGAAVIDSDLFMIFVSVLGMRRGNTDLFCTWSHITMQLLVYLMVILLHLTENVKNFNHDNNLKAKKITIGGQQRS